MRDHLSADHLGADHLSENLTVPAAAVELLLKPFITVSPAGGCAAHSTDPVPVRVWLLRMALCANLHSSAVARSIPPAVDPR